MTSVHIELNFDLTIPDGTPPSVARELLHERWGDVVEGLARRIVRPQIVNAVSTYRKLLVAQHFEVLGVEPPIMSAEVRGHVLSKIDHALREALK